MEIVRINGGGESRENPILLQIVQKTGFPISGARVNYEAPTIAGFIAIESPDVEHATQYIALDNIASFTVLTEESYNITAAFPELRVKTRAY